MDPLRTLGGPLRPERHRRARAKLPAQSSARRLPENQTFPGEAFSPRSSPRHLAGGGGGGGGGGALRPSSGNSVTGAQPLAPGRHACVDGGTWPFCTIARSASSVYGAYVLPSIAGARGGAAPGEPMPPPGGGGGGAAPCWKPPPNAEPIAPPMAKP